MDAEGKLTFMLKVFAVFVILAISALAMWGCPQYGVYQQRLAGEAELAQANYSKQVAVQEANAKMESAKLLAQADVERAKGAAQANVILGQSLKGNEDYLRYLWIQGLENGKGAPTVIYVPTEAGLPILEAGKRP
jgi:hypothetical protein